MIKERWGSLSVTDHVDTPALVANVLLYDRLIFPVFTEADDRDERKYWADHGWKPNLQKKRLELLGDLAVRKPWNAQRRKAFKDRYAELAAIQADVTELDALHLTRRLLAQEQQDVVRPGAPRPDVVAAYNSMDGIEADFSVENRCDDKALQAYLVARKLAIPDIPEAASALKVAVALSRDEDFRERRAELFDWQDHVIAKGYTPEQAVEYMTHLTERYNQAVVHAHKQVYYRFAFVIGGVALGLIGAGLGQPVASASAILALIQFATLGRKPVIEAGSAKPMAAFHDVETRLGLKFEPN